MIIDPLGNIPIERGGTGATTIEEVKEKLGVNYTVLYSNRYGSTDKTITLSDNYSNYTFLEVYYGGNCGIANNNVYWGDAHLSCVKMHRPSNEYKELKLRAIDVDIEDDWRITICSAYLTFSGTTATLTSEDTCSYALNGTVKYGGQLSPRIHAIIGYK